MQRVGREVLQGGSLVEDVPRLKDGAGLAWGLHCPVIVQR